MEREDPRGSNEGLKVVAKRLFIGGFLLLPFLWLMNYLYLRKYIQRASCPPEVKFYVRGSLVGFLVVTSLFAVWTLVFLLFREEMGPAGDSISLLVPKGP
jgi:presenilin enhancer 2